MIKHFDVMTRCMDDCDYPALMAIETACSKDVDSAEAEYAAAYEVYKKAKSDYEADKSNLNLSKKNWAEVEKLRAQLIYQEKYAVYCDFFSH